MENFIYYGLLLPYSFLTADHIQDCHISRARPRANCTSQYRRAVDGVSVPNCANVGSVTAPWPWRRDLSIIMSSSCPLSPVIEGRGGELRGEGCSSRARHATYPATPRANRRARHAVTPPLPGALTIGRPE